MYLNTSIKIRLRRNTKNGVIDRQLIMHVIWQRDVRGRRRNNMTCANYNIVPKLHHLLQRNTIYN